MIKHRLTKIKEMLLGTCKHGREDRGFGKEYDVCTDCGTRLDADPGEFPNCGGTPGKGHCLTTRRPVVCLNCEAILPDPTTLFRTFIRLRKHIRLRKGWPTDRNGKRLQTEPTYNVGIRFVIPGEPHAIRRAWVTFDDKKAQKSFVAQLERRMMLCRDDEGYNEVINEALDIVREANPDIEEQVIDRGDSENDEA